MTLTEKTKVASQCLDETIAEEWSKIMIDSKSKTSTTTEMKFMVEASELLKHFKLVNHRIAELEESMRDNPRQAS